MDDALRLQLEIDQICRADLATFVYCAAPHMIEGGLEPNWHLDALGCAFGRVVQPGPMRLLVAMPPRYCKTFIGSICTTAWLLGRNPKSKIICISYSAELAETFSRDTLQLMRTAWYRRLFPETVLDRQSKVELTTTAGGVRLATSVGGTITGRGGDVIIADDLLSAGHAHSPTARDNTMAWFNGSVLSRFNKPKEGKLIVIGQRLHAEDPAGQLMEAGGWETLIIPAIAQKDMYYEIVPGGRGKFAAGNLLMKTRHSREDLDQLKREMGEHDFEAQYNQQPLPPGGATFKATWLKRYDAPPKRAAVQAVIQSWDTAYKGDEHNDYSVCTTWAICASGLHLLHVWRGRPQFWELERKVVELKKQWRADLVVVETAGSGISLIQNLRELQGHPWLLDLGPAKGKIERAHQQTPKFEQGRIVLPREAEWLPAFESELLSFPHGKHDDQVDSAIQFLMAMDYTDLVRRVRNLR